jgi:hypothetical protein
MNTITAHLAYYGKAGLHTFWQAAAASLLGAFAGSGLNIGDLAQLPVLEKIAGAALVAGAAAVMSYLKQLVVLAPPGTAPALERSAAEAATDGTAGAG